MLLYYIDDSFFGTTEFCRQMRYKLEVLLRENQAEYLLISTPGHRLKEISEFRKKVRGEDLTVLTSTQAVEADGEPLILSNSMVRYKGERIRCFSGTLSMIETNPFSWERIYLDLFPNEETDLMSILTETITEVLDNQDPDSKKRYKS